MSDVVAKSLGQERLHERYSWILVFIAPLFEALSGLLPLVGGYAYVHSQNVISQAIPASTASVTINYLNVLARDDGLASLFIGIFFAAVAATGYRKGERWAWYVMLWGFLMSAVGFLVDTVVQPLPGEAIAANVLILLLLGLMAIGLAFPYGMFFPRKRRS